MTTPRRVLKSKSFGKSAMKAGIADHELCAKIKDLGEGKGSDLTKGVYKQRLNKNMHRGVILAKGGKYWVYQYLFAKADRENSTDDELAWFQELAMHYANLNENQLASLIKSKDLKEIRNEKA
ncbi:MAG: type II toxin-antitoxin system RelE/ParE family toxin [Gemmatimonadaceae bacterium]